jgi:hypothetical protein
MENNFFIMVKVYKNGTPDNLGRLCVEIDYSYLEKVGKIVTDFLTSKLEFKRN